jgi:hypothetical protein
MRRFLGGQDPPHIPCEHDLRLAVPPDLRRPPYSPYLQGPPLGFASPETIVPFNVERHRPRLDPPQLVVDLGRRSSRGARNPRPIDPRLVHTGPVRPDRFIYPGMLRTAPVRRPVLPRREHGTREVQPRDLEFQGLHWCPWDPALDGHHQQCQRRNIDPRTRTLRGFGEPRSGGRSYQGGEDVLFDAEARAEFSIDPHEQRRLRGFDVVPTSLRGELNEQSVTFAPADLDEQERLLKQFEARWKESINQDVAVRSEDIDIQRVLVDEFEKVKLSRDEEQLQEVKGPRSYSRPSSRTRSTGTQTLASESRPSCASSSRTRFPASGHQARTRGSYSLQGRTSDEERRTSYANQPQSERRERESCSYQHPSSRQVHFSSPPSRRVEDRERRPHRPEMNDVEALDGRIVHGIDLERSRSRRCRDGRGISRRASSPYPYPRAEAEDCRRDRNEVSATDPIDRRAFIPELGRMESRPNSPRDDRVGEPYPSGQPSIQPEHHKRPSQQYETRQVDDVDSQASKHGPTQIEGRPEQHRLDNANHSNPEFHQWEPRDEDRDYLHRRQESSRSPVIDSQTNAVERAPKRRQSERRPLYRHVTLSEVERIRAKREVREEPQRRVQQQSEAAEYPMRRVPAPHAYAESYYSSEDGATGEHAFGGRKCVLRER